MEELISEIRKTARALNDLAELIPDHFGSRKSEIKSMINGILDRCVNLDEEVLKVRGKHEIG